MLDNNKYNFARRLFLDAQSANYRAKIAKTKDEMDKWYSIKNHKIELILCNAHELLMFTEVVVGGFVGIKLVGMHSGLHFSPTQLKTKDALSNLAKIMRRKYPLSA